MGATLPQFQRDYIVQLLALGNNKREIIEKFSERYHRTIAPITITRLKKQQKVAIADAHDVIAVGSELVGAAALKQKSYRLLDKKLDRAIEDDTEIDKLRLKLKAGEITRHEFDVECTRYEVMTVHELTKISDVMHTHTKTGEDPSAMTPQDQIALAALVQGINSGNPFQLIQVLNPKVYPNGENPVPPVGTPA